MKFSRWQKIRALVLIGVVGIGSIALIYFIPAPPSKVVMATAFKGASFEYYGRQYQEIFARSHVELELRETDSTLVVFRGGRRTRSHRLHSYAEVEKTLVSCK